MPFRGAGHQEDALADPQADQVEELEYLLTEAAEGLAAASAAPTMR